MSGWRPLGHSKNGVKTEVAFEPDGTFVIRQQQDADPVLDNNMRLRNHDDRGYTHSKDVRRAASIPLVIQYKWMIEEGLDIYDRDHWPQLRRKLNDPDWKWLRTAEWHV